jgi:hypothetical protein
MRHNQVYPGDSWTVENNGRTYRVTIKHDQDTCAPWEEFDGMIDVERVSYNYGTYCGPSKKPGEYVFHRGDHGCYSYVVDMPRAIEKALSESWGVSEAVRSGVALAKGRPMTEREIAVYAVNQNIEFMRGWCADEWCYVGVCVSLLDEDGEHVAAAWAIESISGDYIKDDVIPELISQIEHEIDRHTFPVV